MGLLDQIVQAAEEKKAQDISVLKVSELTTIADFFLITSGSSVTQNQAIADEILKKSGQKPLSVEGYDLAEWILIDFGEIIVHIFTEEKRATYNLESLWADAEKLIRRDEN
ncbi:MAG: ribosome silencing factor [Acidobacteria bacterium]|nr:ribosome silencing factor [Acidobacteriota bacterium]